MSAIQSMQDLEQHFIDVYMDTSEAADWLSDEELEVAAYQAWDRLLAKHTQEYRLRWLRVLADPPEGWRTYGPHPPEGMPSPVEFWGHDPDTGDPLWERPRP